VDGEALRAALAQTAGEHGPGVHGLVTETGRPVFAAAVGVADLDRRRLIDAGDRCRFGSVTTMYVATLVLHQICDDGADVDKVKKEAGVHTGQGERTNVAMEAR
jgi:D-alanyl-D-alanine carboxypeptidase